HQPLSAIFVGANASLLWLVRAVPDVDQDNAALQQIVTSALRDGAVIENIRPLLEGEGGARTTRGVKNLVRQAMAVVHDELRAQRIAVQADYDQWFPRIEGNRVQLQQVLVNLITNAIDSMATEDGQRVLSLRSEVHDSASVMVSVGDTGKGVEPSAIDR